MRAFVKLRDEFNREAWLELIAADLEGEAVVIKEDGVEHISPKLIIDEYYDEYES